MTSARRMLDLTAQFFETQQMAYERNDAELFIETRIQGSNVQWHCYAHTFEDRNQLVVYSVYPALVPENRRTPLAEFASAVNYLLAFGNLEMSHKSGELRLRTAVEMADGNLTPALIAPVVLNNIGMMDDLAPVLMALIGTELTPAAALDQVEQIMEM